VSSFDAVADVYDAARPPYPESVYDALGPLTGALVLEGGAGTGIATRALLRRGARVVPFDVGRAILRKAVARTPGLPAVVADGAVLPFLDACADLVCFAQSWHWLEPTRRCGETARVLRVGGRWAGWWSHPRADGEKWFESYWSAIEAACPGTHRSQRDIDWSEGVRASGFFAVGERVTLPWVREMTVEGLLADERSKSYVAALPETPRAQLLRDLELLASDEFPDGDVRVPYETWLWIATKLEPNLEPSWGGLRSSP
jgi:SAM-dependent methyltransferase